MPEPSTSPQKQKFPGLDNLRSFAIIIVFLFHYQFFGHPQWESQIAVFGWTGVDLFFVLSGFLISRELFSEIAKKDNFSLKSFFLKRFFRIIPPFLVVVLLYSIFPVLRERERFPPVWRLLTFTLNFNLDNSYYRTFTHAWSLCIEEQFYLVLPAGILIVKYLKIGKTIFFLLPVLIVAGICMRSWNYHHDVIQYLSSAHFISKWNEYIYYPTYNRLDGLLVGVGIAATFVFFPKTNKIINQNSNLLFFFGIMLLIFSYFISLDHTSFGSTIIAFPSISLGYGCIVYAIICPSCLIFRLKSRLLSNLATLSYSIYLVHKMVIHSTQTLLGNWGLDSNGNFMFFFCVISTVLFASCMRFLVEKPFLVLRNKILGPSKRSPN